MAKVILITGSTSGIGRVIAYKFAKEGYNVAINGFGKEEDIIAQLKVLENQGIEAKYFMDNLRNGSECKQLVEEVHAHFGRLDVLINNAAMQCTSPIDMLPDEKWEESLSVNLSASFYTIKAALPIMRRQNWGRIINISSIHGLVASLNKTAYVAAKHGLIGLTKGISIETAQENITCNAICPGYVYTPLIESQILNKSKEHHVSFEEEKNRFVSEKHPSRSFVEMQDVAELAFFLTRDCAKQIRGSAYTIDGGWSAI